MADKDMTDAFGENQVRAHVTQATPATCRQTVDRYRVGRGGVTV